MVSACIDQDMENTGSFQNVVDLSAQEYDGENEDGGKNQKKMVYLNSVLCYKEYNEKLSVASIRGNELKYKPIERSRKKVYEKERVWQKPFEKRNTAHLKPQYMKNLEEKLRLGGSAQVSFDRDANRSVKTDDIIDIMHKVDEILDNVHQKGNE